MLIGNVGQGIFNFVVSMLVSGMLTYVHMYVDAVTNLYTEQGSLSSSPVQQG